MQKRRVREYSGIVLLAIVVALFGVQPALAEVSSSPNYQVTETQFNAGSNLNGCSNGYCAQVTIGQAGVGDAASPTGSTASFGQITPDRPSLDVIVEPGVSHLGTLTTTVAGYKTAGIKIRSYLSNGYVLRIMGDPPKYSGYTLKTPNTPTASSPGTEQFGINLVANTTPSFGANPVQVPDDQTSFGQAVTGYDQANRFMYTSGDVVAKSLTASGQTNFTLSMLVNISNLTPAGNFQGDYAAVVVPLY